MSNLLLKLRNWLYKYLTTHFSGKNFLWLQARRRLFFIKLFHSIGLIIFTYITVCYFQYVSENEEAIQNYLSYWKYSDGWIVSTKGDLAIFLDFERSVAIITFFLIFWIIIHFTTFFSRYTHQLVYSKLVAIFSYGFFFLMPSTWDLWFFFQTHIYKENWGFNLLNFIFYLGGTAGHYMSDEEAMDELEAVDEEDEEEMLMDELFIHRNRRMLQAIYDKASGKVRYADLGDMNQMAMPIVDPYKNDLHKLPSIYEVDPAGQIDELIKEKKKRFEDISPGGHIYNDFIRPMGNLFFIYPDAKSGNEQYIRNLKRWWAYVSENGPWPDKEDPGETIIELEARFIRMLVLQRLNENITSREQMYTDKDDAAINEYYEKYIGGTIYLDPWYSSAWFEGKSPEQCFWYQWWYSDQIPYFIKVIIIVKRFFREYKLAKIRARTSNSSINLMDCIYSYFGIPIENQNYIVRREDGTYIAWYRGKVRVMTPDMDEYDEDVYKQPEKVVPTIFTQIKMFLHKNYIITKNILSFFYKLFTHWGSLDFWHYSIKFIIRLPLFIVNVIIKRLKRIYKFFYRTYLYVFVKIMPPIYYFLLSIYYIWFALTRFRILSTKVNPAGPYSNYNIYTGIKQRFIKLGMFRFFFWERKTKKLAKQFKKSIIKSQKRKLFLLWSSNKINKK